MQLLRGLMSDDYQKRNILRLAGNLSPVLF